MGCDSQFDGLYPTAYEQAVNAEFARLQREGHTSWEVMRSMAVETVDAEIRAKSCRQSYYTYFFDGLDRKASCLRCGSTVASKFFDIHIEWHFPESVGKHAAP